MPIHGFGEIDGRLYLDMRLIEGRNLGTILKDSQKPLAPAFAVIVVEQVAAALDAAHEAGLIHRDVKPSNILITEHDFVYLIDFGLARTADEEGVTTAGTTLGTLAYMAPERFDGGQADPRSDIYALTCVLYECLTGSRPYPADSIEQQITGHMVSPPPRPSATDPKLAAFDDVIARGMAKKPDEALPNGGRVGRRRSAGAECARAQRRPAPGGIRRRGARAPARCRTGGALGRCGLAAVVLVAAWHVRGVAVVWRIKRGDARPASLAETRRRGQAAAPSACPRSRRGAERHQGDGPAGDRRQCPLCAKRIQEFGGRRSSASMST